MGQEKFNETHFMLSRVLLVLRHETKGHFQFFYHLVQAEITGSPRLSPFVGSQQQPLHFFKMKRDQLLCDLSTQNYERAPSESLSLKVLSIKGK